MTDPITPITPTPSFNLNLEPNTETPTTPVVAKSVETGKDDRLQKEDQIVAGQDKIVAKNTKIIEKTPENIVKPEAEKPVSVAPVVEKAIETPNPVQPTKIAAAQTPVVSVPTDLQKDLKIIQNLEQTPTQVSTPPVAVTPTSQTVPAPATSVNSFNLDSITATIPAAPQIPGINVPMGGIPTAPNIAANPYDHLSNFVPQIAPTIPGTTGPISAIKGSSETGTKIGVGVGVVFLLLAWFVIKTMYPIQYNDAMNSLFGSDEETVTSTIETAVIGSGTMSGDNILEGELTSGDMLLGNDITTGETLSGDILSGDHSSATDTGAIQTETPDILNPITNMSLDEFKTKLEEFSSQGKLSVLKAKKANDQQLVTESLALYKKAEASLQDIANGKEITTDYMKSVTDEISGYLDKMNQTSDANTSTTENTTMTGTSDFNPDAFFGTSGTSQN